MRYGCRDNYFSCSESPSDFCAGSLFVREIMIGNYAVCFVVEGGTVLASYECLMSHKRCHAILMHP